MSGHVCHTAAVPTTRPRISITETADVAQAIDAAALRWPGLSRTSILVRLALEGHRAAQDHQDERRRRRLAAPRRNSGILAGAYRADHLEHLRQDWPA